MIIFKKHRAFILCFFFFIISKKEEAQNLVPNSSFELHVDCNDTYLSNAFFWRTIGTPDYYNTCMPPCSIACSYSVPNNWCGFQYARTDNAYGGFAAFTPANVRELCQTQLLNTLNANIQYCVKFHVSLADTMQYAIDRIGLYFSDTAIYSSQPILLQLSLPYYIPQIEHSGTFLSDTTNWTEISGIYNATGGEQFITIGNFRPDSLTDTLYMQPPPSFAQNTSYYYLDDISVEEVKPARTTNDTIICTSADSIILGQNTTENASYVWQPATGLSNANAPNPKAKPSVTTTYYVTKTQCSIVTTDSVTITVNDCNIYPLQIPTLLNKDDVWLLQHLELNTQVHLYNSIGQLIYKVNNYQNNLHAATLAAGIYVYYIQTATGDVYKGKLCVVK